MQLDRETAILVAAALAAVTSLVNLFLSEANRRANIRLEYALKRDTETQNRLLELLDKQLAEFYEPISALLGANRKIFETIGPASKARAEGALDDDELARTWRALVSAVIIPNNQEIAEVIKRKSYLMDANDSDYLYQDFLAHAYSYKELHSAPSSSHRLFPFPREMEEHVNSMKAAIRDHRRTLGGA